MTNEPRYEEWLTTIANTRLIYNTMDELEDMLDNHSIHSNGIRRCYFTPQRLRSAFRDLRIEVEEQTNDCIHLELTLCRYKEAWLFYKEKLSRRTDPHAIALELLRYSYPPYCKEGLGPKKISIFQQAIDQNVSIQILVLLLLKAFPGYDSKDGDIADMPFLYEQVISLLEKFVGSCDVKRVNPSLIKAREESHKTRLMLLYHVLEILDTYESFADSTNMYDLAASMKQQAVNLDLAGYWNECGGDLSYTQFWQIEDASNDGNYFLTHWRKDANNKLTGIRYQMTITDYEDGNLVYYIMHPTAIKQHMKGIPLCDSDHTWYQSPSVQGAPLELPLQRKLFSGVWPKEIPLTRCTDPSVIARYEQWLLHDCIIQKPYRNLEYYFDPNLYAATPTHLYIPAEKAGEYYKIPRSAHEGFDRVQLGDNVGTMQMGGKSYLVFDEFLLYIPVTKEELQRYQIEKVNCIL